ncbi:MAG: NAD(P)/FAD-dependent oxidoreductase [Gemmatimonadota bacterium]|nr:NAD(P)/FAD-dependent oxidoreductase [Gemmatimonadota bacterium]
MAEIVRGSEFTQAIVVGAGPGGSSTAFHLAQNGIDVLMLDRASFPRNKVCAEYLSPQASRILSSMGAMEAIDKAGPAHLTGMRVRAPNGYEIHGSFAARHGFRAFRDRGLAIPRSVLDEILVQRAQCAGARLVENTRVTDVLRDEYGRTCGVAVINGEGERREIRAPLVIGADGLRSVVGRRLGLTRVSRFPRRVAFVAHFRNVAGITEVGEMHVERDGYIGIADVGHGLTNVALVVSARSVREAASDSDAILDGWLGSHPHLAARFEGAERVERVRATGPFASSTRRAWAHGAALVGDAADFFDPFTGEGVYSALRGGELLAPFAAEAAVSSPEAGARVLAEYERARRAEFGGKWLVEKLIAGTVAVPALINHAARALSRRREMADLLVGVAGDFVPPSEVLRVGYFARLLVFGV